MRRKLIDARQLDLQERVVEVRRVTKVVKGGRNFRFAALVVVGDENGHVGIGTGKAMEVPDAIKKAAEDAKKNLIRVPIVGTTIPHEVIGHFVFVFRDEGKPCVVSRRGVIMLSA